MTPIRQVVIVGGGTAGWMAAAGLARSFGERLAIELIESDEIGTVGVGEATIPLIRAFHLMIGLDEREFLNAVDGTFKLGIDFVNWGALGESYFHPFGPFGVDTWAAQFHHYWQKARQLGETAPLDEFCLEAMLAKENRYGRQGERQPNYAYHFDAGLYAKLLRSLSEASGVRRTEGKVVDVNRDGETGHIQSVVLESGQVVAGELFIDCSGFRGLLIEQALETGWEDWSEWLRSDRAIAVQTESVSPPAPYTRATARSAGWQWKIPLQSRVGNGLVFSSDYMSEDEALKTLSDNLDGRPINEPRTIRFATGRRKKQWNANVVALGLASGFLEPLESTSIHLIQSNVMRLIKLFPVDGIRQVEVDHFNEGARAEIEYVRDFIILHYHVTNRSDTRYWKELREMRVPDSLQRKIRLFESSGRIFRDGFELFTELSWIAVMIGQGLEPETYHPIVDVIGDGGLEKLMQRVKNGISEQVARQPSHQEFLESYCKVKAA